MIERVGEYSRKGHVEEIEGTRKGFMKERTGDYGRKGHVEEIDSTTKEFMELRKSGGLQ